jgi:ribosomal protein S25
VVDDLFDRPTFTVRSVANRLGIGYSSAQALVTTLEQDGVVMEVTQRKRGRVYMAIEIVEILSSPSFDESTG